MIGLLCFMGVLCMAIVMAVVGLMALGGQAGVNVAATMISRLKKLSRK